MNKREIMTTWEKKGEIDTNTHTHTNTRREREREHWMQKTNAYIENSALSEKWPLSAYTAYSKSNISFTSPSFTHYITFILDESDRRQCDTPQCDAVWRHLGAELAHLIQRKIKAIASVSIQTNVCMYGSHLVHRNFFFFFFHFHLVVRFPSLHCHFMRTARTASQVFFFRSEIV